MKRHPITKVLDIFCETLEEIADKKGVTVFEVMEKIDKSYREELEVENK